VTQAPTETRPKATTLAARPTGAPGPDRPTRANPRGTEPISTLLELPSGATEQRVVRGPASLVRGYDGELAIGLAPDRPVVIANFATTLDGAVAMDRDGRTGGGDVSGFSPTDRFAMGILRAVADTVIVGAGTVRASSGRAWTPAAVDPAHAADFAELRHALGLAPQPATVILTTSGDLDPRHPALADPRTPTIIVGPVAALARLRSAGLTPGIDLRPSEATDERGSPDLAAIVAGLGGRVALFEGGPRLFGAFLAAGLVDELFLTVAPQLVGRGDAARRLALVEGTLLWPAAPTWARLRSVRSAGSHLLLRYDLRADPA
jgi:riboflavin biosynthesis pyrimidine reductase